MHHLLLFLPLLALVLFFVLPWWLALPLYVLILIGSLFGYWKALQAQHLPPRTGGRAMIGDRAVVIKVRRGKNQVQYRGEIWDAVCPEPLRRGQEVIIESVDGLTLRVVPIPQHVER
jgi:membrane protein implicated in regulation of membrane protease activity